MQENNLQTNKRVAGYLRVSTKDQSRTASLQEQKNIIENYAHNKGLEIVRYFGEVESASKPGREIFKEMLDHLRKEKLGGVIFPKTDRSSRNPADSFELYRLMMEGFTLFFASEGYSTADAMGRHMMYIMWGLASGYSENLKTEINKGIMGRLHQGRLPGPPPLGYCRRKSKNGESDCRSYLDPKKAPLVKRLFEEYATGKYSIETMVARSKAFGLTNKNGNYLTKEPIRRILTQPFYYGLICHKRGTFPGDHQPLVTKAFFDKVQYVFKDRGFKIEYHYKYVFQGLLKCYVFGNKLKAMTAKRVFHYYLCRNKSCGIGTISESILEDQFLAKLKEIQFNEAEAVGFKKALAKFHKNEFKSKEEQAQALKLEIASLETRLNNTVQKFVDNGLDENTYAVTREALLKRQIELKESLKALTDTGSQTIDELEELLKLLQNPTQAYRKSVDIVNRRRLIISMVANLELNGKVLIVNWKKPFELVARRPKFYFGGDAGS